MHLQPLLLPLLLLAARTSTTTHAWVSQANDWLVAGAFPATAVTHVNGTVTLSNGLLSRAFSTSPCWATIELELLPTRSKFLRTIAPEASLTLNGQAVNIGGCLVDSQPEFFDPATTPLRPDPMAMTFTGFETAYVTAPFNYTPGERHSPVNVAWPAPGVHLTAHFVPPAMSPNMNSSTFAGPISKSAFNCPSSGCLTGFPSCDNSSVAGQCSWPRASAVAECGKWAACAGVNCNPGRSDCQARGVPFVFGSGQYDVYYRAGSLAPNTSVSLHYEMYDGIPAIHKWVSVSQSAGSVLVDDM